ncbi:MAG: hypothetical protein ABI761_16110 [Saprospiraceae bacterium]
MSLTEMVAKEHSKAQMLRIMDWIGEDKKRFDELVHLFMSGESMISQRAGYPLSNIAIRYPDWITSHLKKIIVYAQKPGLHNAIRRNTMRILEHVPIPKKLQGTVLTMCFDFIADPVEKVAIKAFSLTVLEHMMDTYPEIGSEIKDIIEDQWAQQTPAFRVRAKKVLNKIKKA